ncbi:hypothetical protein [Nonomuraea recticatena]|uniref:Uncharacterized protein n=1 Tax=Nonomuraea recticatena TaxID=46178 RepID=A0ABN3T3C1_9ACTN
MAPRESWFDRVMPWALFILPAITGCILWIKSDKYPPEFAYLCWLCAVPWALILLFNHYRRP